MLSVCALKGAQGPSSTLETTPMEGSLWSTQAEGSSARVTPSVQLALLSAMNLWPSSGERQISDRWMGPQLRYSTTLGSVEQSSLLFTSSESLRPHRPRQNCALWRGR